MNKLLLTIALLTLGVSSLSACNTVEGFGEDLQDAGRAIDKAVD